MFIERSCWDGTPSRGALVLAAKWQDSLQEGWMDTMVGEAGAWQSLNGPAALIGLDYPWKKMPWLKADEMVFLR